MTGVDEQVGRIIRQLKEQGLFDNTIVVFTSDHGDSMGMHEHIGKKYLLRRSHAHPDDD